MYFLYYVCISLVLDITGKRTSTKVQSSLISSFLISLHAFPFCWLPSSIVTPARPHRHTRINTRSHANTHMVACAHPHRHTHSPSWAYVQLCMPTWPHANNHMVKCTCPPDHKHTTTWSHQYPYIVTCAHPHRHKHPRQWNFPTHKNLHKCVQIQYVIERARIHAHSNMRTHKCTHACTNGRTHA